MPRTTACLAGRAKDGLHRRKEGLDKALLRLVLCDLREEVLKGLGDLHRDTGSFLRV